MPYYWVYIGEVDLYEKELEFLKLSQNPEACFFIGSHFSLISLSILMTDFILHIQKVDLCFLNILNIS
jgi:hypothetical protein